MFCDDVFNAGNFSLVKHASTSLITKLGSFALAYRTRRLCVCLFTVYLMLHSREQTIIYNSINWIQWQGDQDNWSWKVCCSLHPPLTSCRMNRSLSGFSSSNLPPWVVLPETKLLRASISESLGHASFLTTTRCQAKRISGSISWINKGWHWFYQKLLFINWVWYNRYKNQRHI